MLNLTETVIKDPKNQQIQQQLDPTLLKSIQPIPFFKLFRFADRLDYFLMFIGSIGALATGAGLPIFVILWGDMINSFGVSNISLDQMVEASKNIMFQFFYLGAGIFVCSWLTFVTWMITGQRQGIVCRKTYLMKLLQQEIGWFDRVNQTQLGSKFASETFSFQSAIGQKVATAITVVSTLVTAIIIALYKGWQLGLVVLSSVPLMAIMTAIYVNVLQNREKKTRQYYTTAGGKAQQVIGSIKTVKSLNGQNYQKLKFNQILELATKNTINYVIWAGFGMGGMLFSVFLSFALAFWYGSVLISDHVLVNGSLYDAGKVSTIFFSLCIGGTSISNIGPSIQKFTEGKYAAARIYALIDRKPKIQIVQNGKKLEKINGIIRFQNVTFCYPKEPNKVILKNLTFQMKSNQTNALVGESGCGKSTIMQLILRFYDPNEGRITLDGIDIRQFDLAWLRSIIGYVGQQPVLFATTIKQNLLYGKSTATNQEIQQALKKAEAFQFISQLEHGLETNVGYGGGQFSGGQKQRIAIARAILKNPKILLLDEATSALDRKNQRLIQQTLDKIINGRTTITIAHRIKTIMHAQEIFVIQDGILKEHGTFQQLKKFKDIQFNKKLINLSIQKKIQKFDGQDEQNDNKNDQQKIKKQNQIDNNQIEEEERQRKQFLIQKYSGQVFSRLFKYNMPDIALFIVGVVVAIGNGIIFPLFSLNIAKILAILINISYGASQSNANQLAIKFVIFGIASFIATGLQTSIFLVIGEKITKRIRSDTFNKIIQMPISWFDLPRNNSGTLSARLSTDCQLINGLTSQLIGVNIQIASTLLSSIFIAFYYEWRTALVTVSMFPILMGTGAVRMKFTMGFSAKTDQAYKDSSNLIMQSMQNIRTVMSFGVENSVYQMYSKKLDIPMSLAYGNANFSGLLFGLSQFTLYVLMALIFYIGSLFMKSYGIGYDQVFTAIYVILFSTSHTGNLSQHTPDVGTSKNAAINLFSLLDDEDQSMIQKKHQSKLIKKTEFHGLIQIKNLTFKYPTRIKQIFKNFFLKIEPGNKIAFVGSSGCGKSTIIQLLLRFYDPNEGQIFLDSINIKDYDVQYLRSIFGLVSQQPVLFNASFKQNIQYNLPDITMKDIRQVARKSHALNFIEGNQQIQQLNYDKITEKGFDRNVGIKGSHISGGQKQRVAIARTILRNPKILLLDEATSALDSKNEKIVQDSLDDIMNGLATITIAHRIQTIKNSDQIYVFNEGKIVESGKYNQLVDLKGHFFHLQQGSSSK